MKKSIFRIIVGLMFLVLALPLGAADTGQINYQARLLDSYGRRVNGTVDLSFKIYDAVTDGNLLWSETQSGITVQDGVYSVILGAQTPVPASVFAGNNVYLELGINGETLLPRQQMTASSYALVARTIMGSNIFENQTSGYLGVGTTNPVAKLDVNGRIQATGFKMPTGASADYVLVSDSAGVGEWHALSYVLDEHDPIFTNWVQITFIPTTNALNTAITTETTARIAADAGISNTIQSVSNALNAAISNEATARDAADTGISNAFAAADTIVSNALNTAKVNRAGDVMTGPLTNLVGFVGNGAGLTNVPESGIVSTSYVHKSGDTMTGALNVSNNLAVSGNATWRPGGQTIVDNVTTIQVAQTFARIGTSDGGIKDFSGCALPIAQGVAGQMLIIQATNGLVKLNNMGGVTLANGVSFSMSTNDTIQLIYDGSSWVEIQRADNNPAPID